jgi:hypothetical protein
MPELRRDHGRQAHLHRETRQGTGAHLAEGFAPVVHGGNIEITGAPERFFAQKLSHEGGLRVHVEAIQRSPEDGLAPAINGGRQPALRQQAQNVFVPKTAELPARVQPGGEIEDFLIQERIADFHGGVARVTRAATQTPRFSGSQRLARSSGICKSRQGWDFSMISRIGSA